MAQIILSIGSNTRDALDKVTETCGWLLDGADGHLSNIQISSTYTTPEHSGRHPDYVNAVASAYSDSSADKLTSLFKHREQQAGRTIESKQTGLVPLDIDLLVYGDTILRPRDMTRDHTLIGLRQLNDRKITDRLLASLTKNA